MLGIFQFHGSHFSDCCTCFFIMCWLTFPNSKIIGSIRNMFPTQKMMCMKCLQEGDCNTICSFIYCSYAIQICAHHFLSLRIPSIKGMYKSTVIIITLLDESFPIFFFHIWGFHLSLILHLVAHAFLSFSHPISLFSRLLHSAVETQRTLIVFSPAILPSWPLLTKKWFKTWTKKNFRASRTLTQILHLWNPSSQF